MKYETNYDILYNEIILLFILSFHANFVQVLILLKNISRNYINLFAKCMKKWKETFILLKIVISKFIQYFWYRINSKRMASLENKLTYLPMKNSNRHVIKVIYTESKFLLINLRQTFTKVSILDASAILPVLHLHFCIQFCIAIGNSSWQSHCLQSLFK